MAKDAGTKQDQPKADVEPDAKVEQDAAEAKAAEAAEQTEVKAEATEQKPPKKAAAKRKPAAKKAEGTAAGKTDVDKDAAEAGATGAEAAAEKPKPARKPRAKKTEEPKEEPKPAPTRRRDAGEQVVVRAHAKYVRSSARKARLIADHVRGKDVNQARAILAFSPRSVADDWRKVLESAIANAEHNHDLVGDDLRILNATADEGPTLKRYRPRAMGRATRIRKRTSHLTITLTPKA